MNRRVLVALRYRTHRFAVIRWGGEMYFACHVCTRMFDLYQWAEDAAGCEGQVAA